VLPASTSCCPILLLGAAGQLGRELQLALAPLGTVCPFDLPHVDITDATEVLALIERLQPVAIVNAAAYTAVDRAEADEALATRVNAAAVNTLALAAAADGVPLVHYSTDYVFDGSADRPYTPDDAPNPLSAYGRSKLAGERAIFAAQAPALILRTSWVFGRHGGNFVKTILRAARTRDSLRVVDDQIGQPTPAALLASVTALLLQRVLAQSLRLTGPALYHVAASGPVSWHAFACAIVEQAQALGIALNTRVDRIAAIPTSDYPTPARRPANSRLDTSRLESEFCLTMPSWMPYLIDVLEHLKHDDGR
jgi:dTDP-4-dehydrorhamnose reductase